MVYWHKMVTSSVWLGHIYLFIVRVWLSPCSGAQRLKESKHRKGRSYKYSYWKDWQRQIFTYKNTCVYQILRINLNQPDWRRVNKFWINLDDDDKFQAFKRSVNRWLQTVFEENMFYFMLTCWFHFIASECCCFCLTENDSIIFKQFLTLDNVLW